MYRYTKNPIRVTVILISLLLISVYISCMEVANSISLLNNPDEGSLRTVMSLYGYNNLVLFVLVLVFFRWLYIVGKNSVGFGAEKRQYKPGQAVVYFFMPIYSLYKPYLAISETWRTSCDPANWHKVKQHPIIPIWWILFLVWSFYRNIDMAERMKMSIVEPVSLKSSVGVTIMYTILCILTIWLVLSINKHQRQLVSKSADTQQS